MFHSNVCLEGKHWGMIDKCWFIGYYIGGFTTWFCKPMNQESLWTNRYVRWPWLSNICNIQPKWCSISISSESQNAEIPSGQHGSRWILLMKLVWSHWVLTQLAECREWCYVSTSDITISQSWASIGLRHQRKRRVSRGAPVPKCVGFRNVLGIHMVSMEILW